MQESEAGLLLIRVRDFILASAAGGLETPEDRLNLLLETGLSRRLADDVYKANPPRVFTGAMLLVIVAQGQGLLVSFLHKYGERKSAPLGVGQQDQLGRLIEEIEGLTPEQWLTAVQSSSASIRRDYVWNGRIPYLGLNAFQERDAEFFFGRESVVADLLDRMQKARFIAIAGPSGSGKSSVARAGLFHALQQGRLERSNTWLLATMYPKGNPLEQLAQALERLAQRPGAGDMIRDHGRDDPRVLHRQLETLLTDDQRQRCVLLVDQFEDTFTQTRDETGRSAFINMLTTAAQVEGGRTTVVISLRSDFISNCAGYSELRTLLNQQFHLVGTMAPSDLATAVTLPALDVGVQIEPTLVSRIIDDMKGEPGALPLMSFALRDLFEAEKTKSGQPMDLTLAEYLQRGGIENALKRHADQVFASFSDEQQAVARDIFSRLVEVGQDPRTVATRRTATFDQLLRAGASRELVEATVDRLAAEDARLITRDIAAGNDMLAEGVAKEATVTLAHDKLIDAWPWLRELVEEKREIIALQNQIQDDAQTWAKDEDPGYLYRGGRLVQAEEKLEAFQKSLDVRSRRFIQASIEQRAAEQQAEREHIRLTILKNLNQASKLALESRAALEYNQELALLLATAALGLNNQPETEAAFLTASLAPYRHSLYGHKGQVFSANFSPDGAYIVTASEDGSARVWDVAGHVLATLRHQGPVNSASFSPDGTYIVTASRDGSAKVWDVAGHVLATLEGHQGQVLSASFSSDGTHIVTASTDNSAQVWDVTGKKLATLKGHQAWVRSARFNPDGSRIVTASDDGSAKVWDAVSGKELAALDEHVTPIKEAFVTLLYKLFRQTRGIGLKAGVNSAVFTPCGQWIVTSSSHGSVKVWDENGYKLASLKGHKDAVDSLGFNLDGTRIITASWDGSAKVWDIHGHELVTLKGHDGRVYSASFSPDGTRIVTASEDGSAKVWDVAGNELAFLKGHKGRVWAASFNPDGKYVVTAGEDGSAKVWNAHGNEWASLQGHQAWVWSASFSPDGTHIVTASEDGRAKVWDVEGKELATLKGHSGAVWSACFSPDGTRILTFGRDGSARVWDVTGNLQAALQGHLLLVSSASFSPDGSKIVTAGGDGTAKVWDVVSGKELTTLWGHLFLVSSASSSPGGIRIVTNSEAASAKVRDMIANEAAQLMARRSEYNGYLITSASFSPDGKRIVTSSEDGSVKVWDVVSGKEVVSLKGNEHAFYASTSASFSPDGKRIVTASGDGSARVWDIYGIELAAFMGHQASISTVSFNSDGTHIVTASLDGSAKVWDVVSGKELASLKGHKAGVNSAAFSPDGTRIITASGDGSAKVWDMTGNELASLDGHKGWVRSAVFSPDGQRIVTASGDGSAKVWDVPASVKGMMAVAKARLTRGFSEVECRRFFSDDPDSCPRTVEDVLALSEDIR